MRREDFFAVQVLRRQGLSVRAISRRLRLHRRSVRRALAAPNGLPSRRSGLVRPSLLDPHRAWVQAKLEQYPELAGRRLWRMLRSDRGFTGGETIVRELVNELRPRLRPAKFTLSFAPGQSAQVDWGSWVPVLVDGCPRRLHFFVMVLCHSRWLYAELAYSQAMEFWLSAHRRAFEALGGVPREIRCDRTRTAVCGTDALGKPLITPAYADFARHYGFTPDPCHPASPDEKGGVENAVKYLRSAFFAGRDPSPVPVMEAALRDWLQNEANVRTHGTTGRRPVDALAEERPALQPLPTVPYDCATERQAAADSRFRITVDANRYSVPFEYASRRLILRLYPERIAVLNPERQLIAEHVRCYARHRNFLIPEHERGLVLAKRHAGDRRLLEHFLALGSGAEAYLAELRERRPDWRSHLRRINALVAIHGRDELVRCLADASEHRAFGADYIQSIIAFRQRLGPEPGPLHVTRRQDLLELRVPKTGMDIYSRLNIRKENDHEHRENTDRPESGLDPR